MVVSLYWLKHTEEASMDEYYWFPHSGATMIKNAISSVDNSLEQTEIQIKRVFEDLARLFGDKVKLEERKKSLSIDLAVLEGGK